jgi:hypothetical protein
MPDSAERSFYDRFVDWLAALPLPWYVLAPVAWFSMSTILAAPLWFTGTEAFGSYPALTRVDPAYLVGSLVAYGYLTHQARRAFDRFRPALALDDAAAAAYRRRISTVTPRTAWAVLVLGGAFALIATFTDQGGYAELMTTTATKIVWGLVYGLGGLNLMTAALIVRQLTLIARLHREATHLDLFRPAPLHAFASLSARTGAYLVLSVTFAALLDPVALSSPTWRAVLIAMTAAAAAAFLVPLLGLARRLRAEKRRLIDESARRIAAVRHELHAAAESRSFAASGELRTMLSALSEDHDRIRKLSPWPWDGATIRGFATTLFLPITTWLVTNLLNRALF